MKLNKLFMGFLGALALTACSSEDVVVPDNGGTVGEGEPRYMSVTIRNANPGTRAEGTVKDPNEGQQFGNYETGYEAENNVNSLRFYFFDAAGNPVGINADGDNFYTCDKDVIKTGDPSANMPNVEKILDAIVVINTNTSTNRPEDVKQMVAIANFEDIEAQLIVNNSKNLSLEALAGIVNREADATSKGFLMTSASYYKDEASLTKTKGFAVEIKDTDIQATYDLAKANPVDVYVERQVAKVRVKADWATSMETMQATYNGKTVTAIALKDNTSEHKQIMSSNADDAKPVYVIFTDWDLWWTASHTYLFKHVGSWSMPGSWTWTHPTYFRSYWAENPGIRGTKVTTEKKVIVNGKEEEFVLSKHSYDYPSKKIIDGNYSKNTYENYSAYCLENAADPGMSGLKMSYNPNTETSNRTLVYLSAVLVTLDENKVATPLELVEWGGVKFTADNILARMFSERENKYYVRSVVGENESSSETPDGSTLIEGDKTYKYFAITVNNVKLKTGKQSGMANMDEENSKRYLSYMQINEDNVFEDVVRDGKTYPIEIGADGKRHLYKYDDINKKFVDSSIEEANADFISLSGAKVWKGGNAYYYHELEHLGQTGATAAENYGVVRNHIYEVTLSTVYGLGTPILTPGEGDDKDHWEDIIPQHPTPDEFFLGARLNILSWRIVNNKAELNW